MSIPSFAHWIDGASRPSESGRQFDVLRPLDDQPILTAAQGTAADIQAAVQSAHQTFAAYRKSAPSDREAWLLRAADGVLHHADELIERLIDETGSPLTKAQREIDSAVRLLRAAAGATRHPSGKTFPTDVPGRMSLGVRRPLGVIAGITPFNVPLIKSVKHSAMPLATGNTVVLLPSPEAPAITIRLAQIYSEAGFPSGSCNVVTGDGYTIGDALTSHPLIRAVGFTGSAAVGRHVAEICGKTQKRVTLELGGKNPLIVLNDADVQQAVRGALLGAFLYQGQICMAASRIYVQRPLFDGFAESFCQLAAGLKMGDLRDSSTMIGPIINHRQRERIQRHLDDAIAHGAEVLVGGNWEGHALTPTVLKGVNESMAIWNEETFGPVTCLFPVDSSEEALRLANDRAGLLSAAVYTSDLRRAMQFADGLDAGMVHINGSTIQEEPQVPFGSWGGSGFGRESTDADIADLTEWQWVTYQG